MGMKVLMCPLTLGENGCAVLCCAKSLVFFFFFNLCHTTLKGWSLENQTQGTSGAC
ncbi:hypothetical protein LY78DRAFT_663673 [Colletotrichum sublineola]|nr:hypothetical protein LY78DRAFT_663673 [Colletotrichum sublineola]